MEWMMVLEEGQEKEFEQTSNESDEDIHGDEDLNSGESEEAEVESEQEEQPKYEPQFKYKVYDQEKEFPDWMKGKVSSKEDEEHFRSLLSKADGLDEMKPRHERIVQERDDYRVKFESTQQGINRLMQLRDKDLGTFLQEVGVNNEAVISYVESYLNAKKEGREDSFRKNQDLVRETMQREMEAESYRNSYQQEVVKQHNMMFDNAISSPEVSQFAQRFDSINGAGAFKEAVRQYGDYEYVKNKKYVNPVEAVNHVYGYYSKMLPQSQGNVAETPTNNASSTGNVQRVQAKPIPNVGRGTGASPTRPKFKTFDEMRRWNEQRSVGE